MRFVPRKLRHIMMLASLGAALTACGGGGGGSSSGATASAGGTSGKDGTYAVLTWEAPSTREDGSCLGDLGGFQISYGLSPGVYDKTETVDVDDMSGSETGRSTDCGSVKSYTYLVENLSAASWYFAVRAVDAAGNVSGYSNEAIKTVQ